MTSHLKPLFNCRLLREAVKPYVGKISDEQRLLAIEWAESVRAHRFDQSKEKNLQGLFLTQIFDRILGYRQVVADANTYHMKPEHALKIVKSGKTPDASLGFFDHCSESIRAVVELKAPGADLDAKQGKGYGQLTPVEQAFGYATKLDGCSWVIVSNFVSIRLYRYSSGQGTCHVINMEELTDEQNLEELLFVLGRDFLISEGQTGSIIDKLASQTHAEEERITKEFYTFYRDVRARLFEQLERDNPIRHGADVELHQVALLEQAQKILDRVLFICFCEDTGLLPPSIIKQALSTADTGFVKISQWQQLQGLFEAVNAGHPAMKINAYNGGLFAKDATLNALVVSDEILDSILALSGYDFETDLNVNILGHVFEQSITDLEAIRAEILGQPLDKNKSKRKKHGVFYTPEYITRFIVARTIGGWLDERYSELTKAHYPKGIRKSVAREIKFYEEYFEILKSIKVLDPACGSGAFLVAAFDFLAGEYERVNRMLADLRGTTGQLGLFDLDRQILQQNIYGVDLNPESVEITKLSLWLKTAHADKPLNNLDSNIRCGNSLITSMGDEISGLAPLISEKSPEITRPFDWQSEFSVNEFDIVMGNPPYVRQEILGPYKAYLEKHYQSYHGTADLYVYFYEKGLRLLAPKGKLSYIVSNKWLRAGYGEPLRRFFADQATFEEIIDFGHAPIFEDVDTFPCIVVYGRQSQDNPESEVRVCPVPRDRNTKLSLEQFVDEHSYVVPWNRYGSDPWSLEPVAVDELMSKLESNSVSLHAYAHAEPLVGVKTGYNPGYLIDEAARAKILKEDPTSNELIVPYLAGKYIRRWHPDWPNQWIILLKSSRDWKWPWSGHEPIKAEKIFRDAHPGVYKHMLLHSERLKSRSDQGIYWWELRSCSYYDKLLTPKIIWQDISFHSRFLLDKTGYVPEMTCFFVPSNSAWLTAVLNSPAMWSWMWRNTIHGKDEALRLKKLYMRNAPIPPCPKDHEEDVAAWVTEISELWTSERSGTTEIIDWLRHEFSVEKPGQKLEAYIELSVDEFVSEVRKRRPKGTSKLKPSDTKLLSEAYRDYAKPSRVRLARIADLEGRLSSLVNLAYALTDKEVSLMWKCAPPRMPAGHSTAYVKSEV